MTQNESSPPIALVGIGCMFPGAIDLEAYWANVRDGVDAITEIPASHFALSEYFDADPKAADKIYASKGGFLPSVAFDPLRYGIPPRDLEATDTTQLLGLMAAEAALFDAGYVPKAEADGPTRELPRERTSVILGVTGALELVIPLGARLGHPIWRRALADAGVDPEVAEDVVQRISDAYVPWQENSFPGLLGNVAAGRIANRLDLHGTNCVVDAACASSLSALHLAMMELRTGKADVALAGGVDTFNDVFMYTCFSKTPALSPSGHARPFDDAGDGTTLGEGVGVLVLKRLSDARRDGDRVYAIVRGIGSSSDGRGQAIYAPDAEGQARALRSAYEDAELDPTSIELVEAHGTGTRVGDATEIDGLLRVVGSGEGPACALGSVKSMIGHTKAAAGVAGVIKAAMALHHAVLPPTLKVDAPNAALAADGSRLYINADKRPWVPNHEGPRRAGVSAFGFGGSNFHCVLEEADPAPVSSAFDGRVQLLAWSADSATALAEAVEAFADGRDPAEPWSTFRAQAAAVREAFDKDAPHRLVTVATSDEQDLSGRLATLSKRVRESDASFTTPQGDAYGRGACPGKVALVLPGQGAQRVGMLRDLACSFRDFAELLAEAERAVPGLSDWVYPAASFDDDADAKNAETLRATERAQPALGAVTLGAWRTLEQFGLQPTAAVGHSYGELAALSIAGCMGPTALFELSRARGEAMAGGEPGRDLGGMVAVSTDLATLEAWRLEHAPELTLANRNAPSQGVLSGPSDAVDAAEAKLKQQGIRHRRLWVGAAFHSPLVAHAVDAFGSTVHRIPLEPPRIPVYSNTTGRPYSSDVGELRELLSGQLAAPVDFVGCIENMYADGVRVFVEVGPGRRLTGLVRSILGDRDAVTVAAEGSEGRRQGLEDLARTLAALAAAAVEVDLTRWDPAPPRLPRPRPGARTVALCGANLKPRVEPRPPRPRVAPAPSPAAVSPLSGADHVASQRGRPRSARHPHHPRGPGRPSVGSGGRNDPAEPRRADAPAGADRRPASPVPRGPRAGDAGLRIAAGSATRRARRYAEHGSVDRSGPARAGTSGPQPQPQPHARDRRRRRNPSPCPAGCSDPSPSCKTSPDSEL